MFDVPLLFYRALSEYDEMKKFDHVKFIHILLCILHAHNVNLFHI